MTDNNPLQQQEELIDPTGSGSILKKERKRQKRSLEEVADELNLSHTQLNSIEADQTDDLPEPTYVRGYIRNYAKLLGLSPDEVLKHYKNPDWTESNSLNDIPKRIGSAEESRGKIFTKRRFFGSLAVLAIVAGLWVSGILPNYFGFGGSPEAGSNQITSTSDQVADEDVSEAEQVDEEATDDADNATEQPVAGEGDAATESEEKTTADEPEVAVDANELVLRFSKTTWVDIRDADKNRLAYKSYAKDEELRVSSDTALSVFIGNAEGVSVEYNGAPFDISEFVEGVYAKFSVGL